MATRSDLHMQQMGLVVKHVDADIELECIENSTDQVTADILAADDHESAVEKSIWNVKDYMGRMVQTSHAGTYPC